MKIATKEARYEIGWGYMANFAPVPGDRRCKAIARFTSNNHPDISKASDPFAC